MSNFLTRDGALVISGRRVLLDSPACQTACCDDGQTCFLELETCPPDPANPCPASSVTVYLALDALDAGGGFVLETWDNTQLFTINGRCFRSTQRIGTGLPFLHMLNPAGPSCSLPFEGTEVLQELVSAVNSPSATSDERRQLPNDATVIVDGVGIFTPPEILPDLTGSFGLCERAQADGACPEPGRYVRGVGCDGLPKDVVICWTEAHDCPILEIRFPGTGVDIGCVRFPVDGELYELVPPGWILYDRGNQPGFNTCCECGCGNETITTADRLLNGIPVPEGVYCCGNADPLDNRVSAHRAGSNFEIIGRRFIEDWGSTPSADITGGPLQIDELTYTIRGRCGDPVSEYTTNVSRQRIQLNVNYPTGTLFFDVSDVTGLGTDIIPRSPCGEACVESPEAFGVIDFPFPNVEYASGPFAGQLGNLWGTLVSGAPPVTLDPSWVSYGGSNTGTISGGNARFAGSYRVQPDRRANVYETEVQWSITLPPLDGECVPAGCEDIAGQQTARVVTGAEAEMSKSERARAAVKISDRTYAERGQVCVACEHFDGAGCALVNGGCSGCALRALRRRADGECPDGRWVDVTVTLADDDD